MSLNQQSAAGGGTPLFSISSVKKRIPGVLPTVNPGNFAAVIENRFKLLQQENIVARFWAKDETLWGEHPAGSVSSYMGWCDILDEMLEFSREIELFSSELMSSQVTDVVLLGMGGSSLAPLVFQQIFGRSTTGITVHVIDTTDPEAIKSAEEEFNIESSLFILASKSGTTAEPNALFEYFYDQVYSLISEKAGSRFVAITDPDTELVKMAEEKKFKKVFLNFPEVGGRFSALTFFGLVPASIIGIDAGELLKRAIQLKVISELETDLSQNPGFATGVILGELSRNGKDKLTFILPEEIEPVYLWLEQLIAESTGKHGKGLLPVKFRNTSIISELSQDRVFVHYYFENREDAHLSIVEELIALGHPVLSIPITDNYDVAREMFRWEMATAVASSLLYVNPFDQPDVQSAKDNTKMILRKLQDTGKLPSKKVSYREDCLRFLYNGTNLNGADIFREFLLHVRQGDFISILAYLNEDKETSEQLEDIAAALERKYKVPVTIGYGPRYLHSTGQFHKGGPNRGYFIQLISEGMIDLPIPGKPYTFSQFVVAQALGDYESLTSLGRKVLRVDIGKSRKKGLVTLSNTILKSLII